MSSLSLDLFDEIKRMRRDLDRILDEDMVSSWTFPFSRISFLPGRALRSYPLMNIGEDAENIYVHALAPGVDPDRLNVSVTGDQLVVSGQKKPLPKDVKPEDIHRSERSAGEFVRSVSLSSEVDRDKVQANYKDGVLKVVLPKKEEAKPKQVLVKVA
ncbi:MAG TPA: Hsp20/alpha crystallin family protein [Terriglobia bacterium]|nr:Hsp20/alpha crystallin family protein [Terriglobia bacterium]